MTISKQKTLNNPITQIIQIQKNVLKLVDDVNNFNGTKKDKTYLYFEEMLTRNLIELDKIEIQDQENVRLGRKEAIRCIQRCSAVLVAKAEIYTKPKHDDNEYSKGPHKQEVTKVAKEAQGFVEGWKPLSETKVDIESSHPPQSHSKETRSRKASDLNRCQTVQNEVPVPKTADKRLDDHNETNAKLRKIENTVIDENKMEID